MSDISTKQARALLWHKGILSWKLTSVQKELYSSYTDSSHKIIVWSCSRRLGKSFALCVIAIEQCIKKPNSVVKFVAPTAKQIKSIIKPLFRQLLIDCPKELQPKFKNNDNVFVFPNGSEIQMAGTDSGHAEALRGGNSNLCLVDEAGFCDDLNYIIQSILIPTTTITQGKIILSSTPPKSQDHEFTKYIEQAELNGNFIKKTIYDALGPGSQITQAGIDDIIRNIIGGAQSNEFRREYLCEMIVDENHSVVPEFSEEKQKAIVRDWVRPPHYDIYISGDIGFKDLTVFLFAYHDFRNGKLVIEDELVMNGKKMTTDFLAKEIKRKETELYTNPQTLEQKQPYLRVCDNNLIVINDLHRLHGLVFLPTAKDDSEAALNNMRILIAQERIIINPRCKTLVFHLRKATWNKSRKSYDRSADAGHYDAIDALKYLVRNVQFNKNPFPTNYGMGNSDTWFNLPEKTATSPIQRNIKDIFKIKRSFKVR